MIISNLKGGLGNQMFEYAAGYSLARDKGVKFKIDLGHFKNQSSFKNETPRDFQLDFFNVKYKVATEEEVLTVKKKYSRGLLPILKLDSYLTMSDIVKYPLLTSISSNVYMDAYFQSEEYFIKYEKEIRKMFTLKEEYITKDYQEVCNLIRKNINESVSVHIQRGDYITNAHANKWHGVLSENYYYNALHYIQTETGIKKPYIYIFSDDSAWVKENLSFDGNITYISDAFNPAQSILLMSKCKHNIIANSSFSWWGAWLNENKDKIVVAPDRWLAGSSRHSREIVPEDWVRCE